MSPILSSDDVADQGIRGFVFSSKRAFRKSSCGPVSFDPLDNLLCESCRSHFGTTNEHGPAFPHTVMNIVKIRSKKQVIGIDARWVVAPMKNVELAWNVAMMDHPREPVRTPNITEDLDSSIAERISESIPEPAVIRSSHLLQESLNRGSSSVQSGLNFIGGHCSHMKSITLGGEYVNAPFGSARLERQRIGTMI